MPEIISCPDCDKKLRVPDDLLGKKVKCPGCSVMFTARDGNAVNRAAARDEEEAPRRRDRRAPAREDAIEDQPRAGRRAASPFEDLDDRPRSRRRHEDEEGRPRARRRHEDEDEEGRPRARRRRDEEEEDEDHPRSRRPRYEDEDEDEDRPRPGDERKGWQGVRLGLNLAIVGGWLELAYYGAAIVGTGMMVLFGASLLASMSGPNPNVNQARATSGAVGMGVGLILLLIVLGLLALAEVILRVTGYGLTMQVQPRRNSGIKGLSIAAFACACAAVVVNVGGFALSGASGFGNGGPAALLIGGANGLGWLAGLLRLAGFVLFLLFLRSVCANLRDDGQARAVVTLLIAWFVYFGVAVLTVILLAVGFAATLFGAGTRPGAAASIGAFGVFAIIVAILVGLAGLGLCVWYVLVVTQVRNLVDWRLKKM